MMAANRPTSERNARIYAVVDLIPYGHVATYGQVAALAGMSGQARQAGYALHDLPTGSNTPWHRVINTKGEVSPRSEGDWDDYQRHLLETEGVVFGPNGRLDLGLYRWEPAVDGLVERG
jgi:methylated-DNA-protein-cysteine methyltransferase-like protein